MTVRVHGKKPYRAVVVHGGPGAIGSAAGLAKGLAEYCGVMEPLQSEHTVNGQIEELKGQITSFNGGSPLVLIGHSWGAWLCAMTAAKYPELASKLILVDSGPLTEQHSLATLASIPQLRMTRCIRGAYEMDDTEAHKSFVDSIGMAGDWRKCGPAYEIPLRTLYTEDLVNCMAAGRIISVTDAMWDITRVIPACAVTGQAAGLAMAMTDDVTALDVSLLQNELVKQGVLLHLQDAGLAEN